MRLLLLEKSTPRVTVPVVTDSSTAVPAENASLEPVKGQILQAVFTASGSWDSTFRELMKLRSTATRIEQTKVHCLVVLKHSDSVQTMYHAYSVMLQGELRFSSAISEIACQMIADGFRTARKIFERAQDFPILTFNRRYLLSRTIFLIKHRLKTERGNRTTRALPFTCSATITSWNAFLILAGSSYRMCSGVSSIICTSKGEKRDLSEEI